MMMRTRVEETVETLAEPVATSMGLELVQVIYRRESEGWVLRLLVDRVDPAAGGVTVEECRLLSRELSDLLDVEDPVPSAYRLEVSSPGLDRPLVKPTDFVRFAGRRITLRTSRPVTGRRNFSGRLIGLQDQTVVLEADGQRYEIAPDWIVKANLVPEIEGYGSRPGD